MLTLSVISSLMNHTHTQNWMCQQPVSTSNLIEYILKLWKKSDRSVAFSLLVQSLIMWRGTSWQSGWRNRRRILQWSQIPILTLDFAKKTATQFWLGLPKVKFGPQWRFVITRFHLNNINKQTLVPVIYSQTPLMN